MTPLYYCVMNNNDDLCYFFIHNGVKPDIETLITASRSASLNLIKILLSEKLNLILLTTENKIC